MAWGTGALEIIDISLVNFSKFSTIVAEARHRGHSVSELMYYARQLARQQQQLTFPSPQVVASGQAMPPPPPMVRQRQISGFFQPSPTTTSCLPGPPPASITSLPRRVFINELSRAMFVVNPLSYQQFNMANPNSSKPPGREIFRETPRGLLGNMWGVYNKFKDSVDPHTGT